MLHHRHSCNKPTASCNIHCVAKLAPALASNTQFVVDGFQQNIVHCTILSSLSVIPYCTLPCVLSVKSLWCQSMFTSELHSVSCYRSSTSIPA